MKLYIVIISALSSMNCATLKMIDEVTLSVNVLDSCIMKDNPNKIEIKIENNFDKKIVINGHYLFLDNIYSINGDELIPFKLIEPQVPAGIKEYYSIAPFSAVDISFTTSVFDSYDLKKGEIYKVVWKYETKYLKERNSNELFLKSLHSKPISIHICN